MITDVSVFCGAWPSRPVNGRLESVKASLQGAGVERALLTPLDAAWCRNPHAYNDALYRACEDPFFLAAPALDPTVATWEVELGQAAERSEARAVRLFPAYSPYSMKEADGMLAAAAKAGLGVIVQTRMEDPRAHHPLAQVPDVNAKDVMEASARHPELTMVIAGARTAEIRSMKERAADLPNLYADVSQADGMVAVRSLVDEGLGGRLLFGSHVPLFTPRAAMVRVTADLNDEEAARILEENAEKAFGL